jgi:dynactin complex subunit
MQFPLAFPEDQDKVSEPLFCSLTDKEAVRLLKQGAYYCNLEGEHRQRVCHSLAQQYREKQVWQAGWLLAYSFSDKKSCITHKERLAILNDLNQRPVQNQNRLLTWLNESQEQTLEVIDTLKANQDVLEQKIEAQNHELEELRKENAVLKSQIQALKSIEKTLNKRIDDER